MSLSLLQIVSLPAIMVNQEPSKHLRAWMGPMNVTASSQMGPAGILRKPRLSQTLTVFETGMISPLLRRTYIKCSNKLFKKCRTKATQPNIPNKSCQNKPARPNLAYQTYQTKPTKPSVLNKTNQHGFVSTAF